MNCPLAGESERRGSGLREKIPFFSRNRRSAWPMERHGKNQRFPLSFHAQTGCFSAVRLRSVRLLLGRVQAERPRNAAAGGRSRAPCPQAQVERDALAGW